MTTLNAACESKLALEDEAMKVVVKTSTYPLPSEKPPRFTIFPVSRMPLSIQIQLHHATQVQTRHITDLYVNI